MKINVFNLISTKVTYEITFMIFFFINIIIISHYFVSLYYKNNNYGSSIIGQKKGIGIIEEKNNKRCQCDKQE